jgi:hypothetical protein
MPIDPRIPLGVQPAPIQSPLEMFQAIAQLQGIREQTELRRQAAEEARTKHLRQQQIGAAYRDAIKVDDQGEVTVDYGLLTQHLPGDLIPGVIKELQADKTSALALKKTRMDLAKLGQEYLGGAAKTILAAKGDQHIWELELQVAHANGALTDDAYQQLVQIQDPEQRVAIANSFLERAGMTPKLEKIVTTGPGGEAVTQFVTPTAGATYPVPPPKPPPLSYQAKEVLLDGRPTMVGFNPQTNTYEFNGQDVSSRVRPIPPQGPAPDYIWIQDPNDPTKTKLVTKQQAAAIGAQRPAGGEGSRPVTSGDANRIADMDTGRSDLATLNTALSEAGATGTLSKAGASLPNWVTDVTGWGTDAKKKQAMIDRVKQVIGKTLEGGVLRKEDEVKYEKILPTIGDTPEVVTSKLQGLDTAIAQRRQTHLDALADAGYDVSRFAARPTRPPLGETAKQPAKMGERRTINGQLAEWDGKGWKAVR